MSVDVAAAASPTGTGTRAVYPGPTLELLLFDGFELRVGGARVEVPLSVQRVLAFLAVHDRPVQRLYVSGSLWGDSSEARASASLRTALWRLRAPGFAHTLRASPTQLSLGANVGVDLRDAVAAARSVIDGDAEDEAALRLLVSSTDLLPDWYEDWVLVERERIRQLRLHALELLCGALGRAGRYARAVEAGLAAVAAEPLRETAHRALIEAHLAAGNVAEALRQLDLCRRLLRDQLGLEPSPLLRELAGHIGR